MDLRSKPVVSIVTVLAVACRAPERATGTDGAWVGTITTEGNVTTVVNESGSVWGGAARLVEEASIGVESGADAYMLGEVRGVAATDERIYVVDAQVPALRVYDWRGNWLHDVGRRGQGPGEFQFPTGVGVDGQGRVWLHEQVLTRMVVYSAQGEALATRNIGGMRVSGNPPPMTVTDDGRAYVFDVVRPDEPTAPGAASRRVMRPHDIDGAAGEPLDIPQSDNPAGLEATSNGAVRFTTVPFHPRGLSAFAPTRAMFTGYPDDYRFEVHHPDGRAIVIERAWDPVPVLADEAAAHHRAVTAYMRGMDSGWTWNGPEIPATKPAYTDFVPAVSGEVWVVCPGRGTRDEGCDEGSFEPDDDAPCWDEERIIDVFDADGRYLGELDAPPGLSLQPRPFIRGSDVIARFEDDAGTIMVKRYRLLLPGGGVGEQ